MKLLFFLFLFPLSVFTELHDYEDIRKIIPSEYLEQFDIIVDDTSVCEEETNRRLIVLGNHFDQQQVIREILVSNARELAVVYERFISVSQRIHKAKRMGQSILADRNQTDRQQYDAAIKMDKLFSLEMSALLEICETLGFKDTEDIIRISLENPPKVKQLARDLEEYAIETQKNGWAIAQALHDEQFASRRYRAEARQSFLKTSPKAMQVHDHVLRVLTRQEMARSPVHAE